MNEALSPVREKFPNRFKTSTNALHSKRCIAADQRQFIQVRALPVRDVGLLLRHAESDFLC